MAKELAFQRREPQVEHPEAPPRPRHQRTEDFMDYHHGLEERCVLLSEQLANLRREADVETRAHAAERRALEERVAELAADNKEVRHDRDVTMSALLELRTQIAVIQNVCSTAFEAARNAAALAEAGRVTPHAEAALRELASPVVIEAEKVGAKYGAGRDDEEVR